MCRGVLQQSRDQVDRVRIGFSKDLISLVCDSSTAGLTYLVEWMRLDLRKLVLHVVWVHGPDLIPRWSTQNLDDLHELIDSGLSREQRLSEHQLSHDTAS